MPLIIGASHARHSRGRTFYGRRERMLPCVAHLIIAPRYLEKKKTLQKEAAIRDPPLWRYYVRPGGNHHVGAVPFSLSSLQGFRLLHALSCVSILFFCGFLMFSTFSQPVFFSLLPLLEHHLRGSLSPLAAARARPLGSFPYSQYSGGVFSCS